MLANSNYTDQEHANRFQEGDENSLSFFYQEFYPALVYYSFQIVQSRPVAEEIASEAFVKTWRMHYKLDSYVGIKAYLYKIVHRDSIEAISKEQKRARYYKNIQPAVNTDSPFDNMVRSEVYHIIHTALKDLPPASRRVVIMHYLEGKSTGQIARELKLHTSTIKTQKMQGLKALRKIFVRPLLWLFYICINFFWVP